MYRSALLLLVPTTLLLTSEDGCEGTADEDADGWVECADPSQNSSGTCDCNDSDPAINPGAAYVSGAVDHDCDGQLEWVLKLEYSETVAGIVLSDTTYVALGTSGKFTIPYDGSGYKGSSSGHVFEGLIPSSKEGYYLAVGLAEIEDSDPTAYGGYVTEFDERGVAQWSKTYTTDTSLILVNGTLCQSGDYLLVGRTFNNPSGRFDGLVLRVAPDGTELWRSYIQNPTESVQPISIIESTLQDTSSVWYHIDSVYDVYRVQIDAVTLDQITESWPYYTASLIQTLDAGLLVIGYPGLQKLSQDGDLEWTMIAENSSIGAYSIESASELPGGGYIAIANWQNGGELYYIVMVRIDVDGSVLWERILSPVTNAGQYAHTVEPTHDGGFVAFGNYTTSCSGSGSCPHYGWVMKTDADGNAPFRSEWTP